MIGGATGGISEQGGGAWSELVCRGSGVAGCGRAGEVSPGAMRRKWLEGRGRLHAVHGAEASQHLQSPFASLLLVFWCGALQRVGWNSGWLGDAKGHAADVEIFLKPIGLKQIGEL